MSIDVRTHLFSNNARSRLASNVAVADTAITLTTGSGQLFPEPGYGEIFKLTLENTSTGEIEILACTERVGDTLYVERAQEDTEALDFNAASTKVEHRITAETLEYLANAAAAGGAPLVHYHAAGDVTSGVFATTRLGSGTASADKYLRGDQTWAALPAAAVEVQIAASGLTSAITTGVGKAYVRAAKAFTLNAVRASLFVASSSGIVTVNIKKNGTTIFTTKLTVDQGEKTSVTAATPYAFSAGASVSITDDDEISIDIDDAGTGAYGLIVTLLGEAA